MFLSWVGVRGDGGSVFEGNVTRDKGHQRQEVCIMSRHCYYGSQVFWVVSASLPLHGWKKAAELGQNRL